MFLFARININKLDTGLFSSTRIQYETSTTARKTSKKFEEFRTMMHKIARPANNRPENIAAVNIIS